MLTRQPAPQRSQAERARVPHAASPRVLKKRLNVPLVGADGMTGQGTLRREVPAELSQRRTQRRGQALRRAIRECDFSLIDVLASALVATCPDPVPHVTALFDEGDGTAARQALEAVAKAAAGLATDV